MIKMSLIYHREAHKILHFKNAEPARKSTSLFLCRSAVTMQRRTSVRKSWWTDGQLPYRLKGEHPDHDDDDDDDDDYDGHLPHRLRGEHPGGKRRLFSQREQQQGGK